MMRGPDITDGIHFKYTDGQSEAMKESVFSNEIWEKLGDKNYKIRLEGIVEGLQLVKSQSQVDPEVAVRLLSQRPGWKESNFQVNGGSLQIIQYLINSDNFGAAPAAIVIPFLLDKVGDNKNKQLATESLNLLAKNMGLGPVLALCLPSFASAKAVKTITEHMLWTLAALSQFGSSGINIRDLVEQIKETHLSHSNGAVRAAAASVIAELVRTAGPKVQLLLKDQSTSLQNLVQAEIDRTDSAAPVPAASAVSSHSIRKPKPTTPEPARRPADTKQSESDSQFNDETLPRVDLVASLPPSTIEQLESSNWKLRKEALDNIQTAMGKANGLFKPHLGDLQRPLSERLLDSNKKLVIQTLEILVALAKGTGKPFEKSERAFVPNCISCLSDKSVQVRQAALAALDSIFEAVGIRTVLPLVIQSVSGVSNPLLRTESFNWLTGKLSEDAVRDSLGNPKAELTPLVKVSLQCLQDRDLELRKAVQAFMPLLVNAVGFSALEQACASMPSRASAQAALASIEQFRGVAAKSSTSNLAAAPPIAKRSAPSAKSTTLPQSKNSSLAQLKSNSNGSSLKSLGSVGSSKASLAPATADIDYNTMRLFLTSDVRHKERRAELKGQLKWYLDTAKDDLVGVLLEQSQHVLSGEWHSLMFSDKHYKEKDHMLALSILDTQATATEEPQQEFVAGLLANLDIVLKYITVRLLDTNTSMALKTFDCLKHVLLLLEKIDYRLTEYEASCLLSFVIFRLGDSKETIRARSADILRQMCRLYPASKLVHHLLDSLSMKNARVRAEALEQLAVLVKRNGISVIAPTKVLPVVALQIGDRDGNVRNAALNVMVQVYLQIGDQIHAFIRLSDKEGTMLEERLKRVPAPKTQAVAVEKSTSFVDSMSKKRPTTAKSEHVASTESQVAPPVKEFHLNLEKLGLGSTVSLPGNFPPSNSVTISSSDERLIELVIEQIASDDLVQCVDGLKQMDRLIEKNTGKLPKYANALADALSTQLKDGHIRASDWTPAQLQRLSKHIVNVLLGFASRAPLISSVSRDPLRHLLIELLSRMLEQASVAPVGDGSSGYQQSMTRAYSLIMIRILENCDRNLTFSLLIDLLYDSQMEMKQYMVDCRANGLTTPAQIAADPSVARQANFTELTMKCLWKLTKLLQSMLAQGIVDPRALFLDIHTFLTKAPPAEWKEMLRQQAPNQDMSYRTVKTILHELVTHLGAPFAEMAQAALPPNTPSTALAYVLHAIGKREVR